MPHKPSTLHTPSFVVGTRIDDDRDALWVQARLPRDVQIHGIFDGGSIPPIDIP